MCLLSCHTMIKCLSKEVQARLRSGIAIFSLQQCVEELVLNGIDAGATCIAVRLDMEAFKVQVIDNGSGMGREDMEQVGKRYFTSKCSSLEDLESLRFYGFRGEAVSSIASLATLVEIASRSRLSGKTFVKIFRDGKGMDVFESESCRPSSGTTVVICNFFHNMPVRRKRVDVVLECERIRQRVEAISLMHPSISFTLKNDCTGVMVVQLPKAKSTYFRFVQIHGLARAQKLAEISLKHSQFEISGYIGREGHYNNSLQFLFVNGRLVLRTRIHKLLNFLLKKINVPGRQNGNQGGSPAMGSPKQRAGAEVHGVYIINITCHCSEYDICLEPAKTLIEFKDWDGVLICVEEGVKEFLTRENLVAELSPEDVCRYVQGNYFTEPMANTIGDDSAVVHAFAPAPAITEELCSGNKLMSKAVLRMFEQDTGRAKSVHLDKQGTTADEKRKKPTVTVIPGDQEQTVEHVSLTGATISHSFDSETDERADNCGSVAGICLQKCEPMKCIIEGMESHQNVQLENVVGTTDLGCSELQCSANTKTMIMGEQQGGNSKECEEKVDDVGLWHSETHDRKISEWCNEGELQRTILEKQSSEASNSGRTTPRLGSVGFIKHLVPQLQNADIPKTNLPGRVCSLGPVSAQDLLPLKECHFRRDYGSSTSAMVPSSHSKSLSSHKRDIYQNSDSSAFEAPENPLLAAKRKLSLSAEPCAIASKASKIKPCPKLALSVQTGSLDRFRRMYGKETGAQCHPLETAGCATSHDAITSQTECAPVDAEKLSLCQSEESETSETLKACSLQPSDYCLTLSEYTRLKPFTVQTRSSEGSLAAKLSCLKQNDLKDKRTALERPLGEASDFFSSLDSALTDTLKQDGCNTEEQACTHLCSIEVNQDMNANYQRSQMELHCDTSVNTKSPQLCKNALTTAHDMPTPVLSAEDSVFDSVKMVTSHNLDVCSDEVLNSIEKDGSMCTDTALEENEQTERIAVGSSDWLEHFDDSIGKLVYINKVTGLSKYETPVVDETQVPCTTDVTTMSVSVISRKGFEYICYPFQSELVLPFLPRSRAERVLSSGLDHTDGSDNGNSLSSMFSEWSNPVFVRPPEVAVDVTSGQAEGLAVKIHNILYPYRFTKEMIHSMKVVHQVDKKFLACLINTRDMDAERGDAEGNLLVLVDQHAAHERVRLENLIAESYEDDPEVPGQKRLCASSVTPPLEIEVTEEELRLLRSCQPFLRGLGLEIRFAETGHPQLLVGKVPMCFVEREASELRRGRHTATKAIVEEYIREQIELLRSAGRVRGTLPLTVLKVLASQACHGAVKFNHSLSVEECCSLVGSLSNCQLPFQCAHGRPSLAPLADLLHLDNHEQEPPKPNLRKLRRMYRAWELYGKQ